MRKWVIRIGFGLAMIPLIYLGIGFGLAFFSSTAEADPNKESLNFDFLNTNTAENIPTKKTFKARDGQQLTYRDYAANDQPSDLNTVLILMHGSGYHSEYLWPLASYLADENIANVYTPNMRGHGEKPEQRGDVEYVGQLEDDLNDFLHIIKNKHPDSKIILGGHSSGGGLVIRYAGEQNTDLVDGYLLLAPYIHHDSSTNLSDSQWANPNVPRIVGLSMLNQLNISMLNHLSVISYNMPEEVRNGSETLSYSYRMQYSMVPRDDYGSDIEQLQSPALVIAGSEDQSFNSDEYEPLFESYSEADVRVLDGLSHFGIVTETESHSMIADWVREL